MSKTLYTRVSPGFAENGLDGHVLLAGEELSDTYGFTELGYDQVDYDTQPIVYEVTPKAARFATREDVERAAEAAGVKVWLTKDEYMSFWPGATEEQFKEREFADDGTEPNELLENPAVRAALEEAGFDAFRDFVVVSNTQPELHAFWKEGTFELSGPVELEPADDADGPYDVKIAGSSLQPGA